MALPQADRGRNVPFEHRELFLCDAGRRWHGYGEAKDEQVKHRQGCRVGSVGEQEGRHQLGIWWNRVDQTGQTDEARPE